VLAQARVSSFEELRLSQMRIRYLQSVLTALLVLGSSLGLSGIRLLLGNQLMAFLAAISYQVYLWHQVLAVQFRTWRIPASEHVNPNMVGDRGWQVAYVLLVTACTLVISTAVTYLVEQPLTRRLTRRRGAGRTS